MHLHVEFIAWPQDILTSIASSNMNTDISLVRREQTVAFLGAQLVSHHLARDWSDTTR